MKSYANDFIGQKFKIESSIGGTIVHGVATIRANYQDIAWGPAQFGNVPYFHTYFLEIKNGKIVGIRINSNERFDDGRGGVKYLGTEEEVKKFYEILIGSRCENDILKKRRDEELKKLAELGEARTQKSILVKSKRSELEAEVRRLSSGLSIDEILQCKELQTLALKFAAFDRVFPPRLKK